MTEYLAEVYAPATADFEATVERAGQAAADATCRLLRSVVVPDDETWYLLYDAASAEQVARAAALAGVHPTRIASAHALPLERTHDGP